MTRGKKRQVALYFVSAALAAVTIILYSLEAFPGAQIEPAVALAPVVAFRSLFGSTWLPGALLVALAAALGFLATRIPVPRKTGNRAKRTLGALVAVLEVLCVAYVVAAGIWILAGGEVVSAPLDRVLVEVLRLVFFPAALILYAAWQSIGWPAYLIPGLLLGLGVLSLMDRRARRRRATTLLLWGYAEGILLTLSAAVLFSQNRPLLAHYFSAVPFGSVLLVIGTVVSGLFLFLHGANRKVSDLLSAKKRRPKDTQTGRTATKRSATKDDNSPASPIILDLDPPAEQSAVWQDEHRGGEPPPPPEEETEDRRRAVSYLLSERGLSLRRGGVISGPRTVGVQFQIPRDLSVRHVAKQCQGLETELGGSCMGIMRKERELTFLFERRSPEILSFDTVAPILEACEHPLPVYVGRAVDGSDQIVDLAALPHLLVAGTTGSGKSVFLHSVIRSLTDGPAASRVRLVLCDPKRVEFAGYAENEHIACPILDEPEHVATALGELVDAMEKRYAVLSAAGARSILAYNADRRRKPLSWVVVIIDEVADLLLSESGKQAKRNIVKLAQKSRAVGIHLVLATQRPSSDIIDGLIKANFPARVAFRTATSVDSRVILDAPGAETLAGRGDGLFIAPPPATPVRFQGAFVPGL